MPPLATHRYPDYHQILLDALEKARQEVCHYGPHARTCDCKWGLVPPTDPAAVVPINAIHCTHRNCEHSGCPELRNLMGRIKREQRARWARLSEVHELTSHGEGCCAQLDTPDKQETTPGKTHCGGYWWCAECITEADRTHGLLPPLAEPA